MTDVKEIIPFGKQEPEMSKQTKILYVLVQHENPIKKIDFKDFIKNIKHHCKIQDFPWECRDEKTNRRIYPTYDRKNGAKNWFNRYDYKEAYRIYANHENDEDNVDLLLLEKSLRDTDIRDLFLIAKDILQEIKEMAKDQKYEYRRKASMETYVMVMSEIRRRLEIDGENLNIKSENVNTNLNLNVDDETEEERLDRYADYFKRINSKATSISGNNNIGQEKDGDNPT